jgi:hypothetical protein
VWEHCGTILKEQGLLDLDISSKDTTGLSAGRKVSNPVSILLYSILFWELFLRHVAQERDSCRRAVGEVLILLV